MYSSVAYLAEGMQRDNSRVPLTTNYFIYECGCLVLWPHVEVEVRAPRHTWVRHSMPLFVVSQSSEGVIVVKVVGPESGMAADCPYIHPPF
jgi:hypothetical protein